MSSITPWAPSNRTLPPLSMMSLTNTEVSQMWLPYFSPQPMSLSVKDSTVHWHFSAPMRSMMSFFIGRTYDAFSRMVSGSRRSPALNPILAALSW